MQMYEFLLNHVLNVATFSANRATPCNTLLYPFILKVKLYKNIVSNCFVIRKDFYTFVQHKGLCRSV